MTELVKYKNYLNTLRLKGFTSTDLDFFMTVCAKIRDKDTTEISFALSEIKELSNYSITSKKRFVSELKRMNKKLMEVTCELEFDNRILMFVLFPTFEIDLNRNVLIVSVNERFKFILNGLVKDFTRFELKEFVSLNSKYSKNLYRLLKQYRTTGVLKITDVELFREKLDCPKKYIQKYFLENVLKPAIQELQEKKIFKNLTCEPVKARKRGAPIIGYVFTFEPEPAHKKVEPKQTDLVFDADVAENVFEAEVEVADEPQNTEILLDEMVNLIDSYRLDIGAMSVLNCARKAVELGRDREFMTGAIKIVKSQNNDNTGAKLMHLIINGYDEPKKNAASRQSKNSFNNFNQRKVDAAALNELERRLLHLN